MKNSHNFELWRSADGVEQFFPADNESARKLLGRDAQPVKTFQASSWEEAQQKRHEFLGLGPYVPAK
jgi:hypothetical protein